MRLPVLRLVSALSLLLLAGAKDDGQSPSASGKRRTTPEVWHPRLEQFSPPGVIGTELGSPLSEGGYRKLRNALPWKEDSERTDYYFDAYNGQQFLLRTGGMPLKVRIKLKKEKAHWQVSRFVTKDRVVVGTLSVKVHTTESWEGTLKGDNVRTLLAASDEFTARLSIGGAPLRESADKANDAWLRLRDHTAIPGLMVIDRTIAGRSYRFYPRKVTSGKVRLSAMLPGFSGPAVKLMLGTEPEVNAKGETILTYELEAEPDGPATPAQIKAEAIAIGKLMQKAGLTARDQQEVLSFSNDYTLRQLKH